MIDLSPPKCPVGCEGWLRFLEMRITTEPQTTAGLVQQVAGTKTSRLTVDMVCDQCGTEFRSRPVEGRGLKTAEQTSNTEPAWLMHMATILEDLPVIVRTERKRRGLSHKRAAEDIGYAYADLCRFENGKKNPTLPQLVRLLRWVALSLQAHPPDPDPLFKYMMDTMLRPLGPMVFENDDCPGEGLKQWAKDHEGALCSRCGAPMHPDGRHCPCTTDHERDPIGGS